MSTNDVIAPVSLQEGLLCVGEEFLRTLTDVLAEDLIADRERYADMSEEEYNLIRPSAAEKARTTAARLKTYLSENGKCGNCTEWQMSAAEVKGIDNTKILDVGMWRPVQGLQLYDDLFPHVSGGLRGRTVTVGAIDVSLALFDCHLTDRFKILVPNNPPTDEFYAFQKRR